MEKSTNIPQAEFPGQVHQTPGGGILVSKLDDVINWARANSLWPLVFGTSGADQSSTRSGCFKFVYLLFCYDQAKEGAARA